MSFGSLVSSNGSSCIDSAIDSVMAAVLAGFFKAISVDFTMDFTENGSGFDAMATDSWSKSLNTGFPNDSDRPTSCSEALD